MAIVAPIVLLSVGAMFPPKRMLTLSVEQLNQRRIQLESYFQQLSQARGLFVGTGWGRLFLVGECRMFDHLSSLTSGLLVVIDVVVLAGSRHLLEPDLHGLFAACAGRGEAVL